MTRTTKRLISGIALATLPGGLSPLRAEPACEPLAQAMEALADAPNYRLSDDRDGKRAGGLEISPGSVTSFDEYSNDPPGKTRASVDGWLRAEAGRIRASKGCTLMMEEYHGDTQVRVFSPENSDDVIWMFRNDGLIVITIDKERETRTLEAILKSKTSQ